MKSVEVEMYSEQNTQLCSTITEQLNDWINNHVLSITSSKQLKVAYPICSILVSFSVFFNVNPLYKTIKLWTINLNPLLDEFNISHIIV